MVKVFEQNPDFTQRQIAVAIGLSFGKTNYVLRVLMEKGFLKVVRFLKAKNRLTTAAYILIPSCIRERMNLTQDYIVLNEAEYENLKSQLQKTVFGNATGGLG